MHFFYTEWYQENRAINLIFYFYQRTRTYSCFILFKGVHEGTVQRFEHPPWNWKLKDLLLFKITLKYNQHENILCMPTVQFLNAWIFVLFLKFKAILLPLSSLWSISIFKPNFNTEQFLTLIIVQIIKWHYFKILLLLSYQMKLILVQCYKYCCLKYQRLSKHWKDWRERILTTRFLILI